MSKTKSVNTILSFPPVFIILCISFMKHLFFVTYRNKITKFFCFVFLTVQIYAAKQAYPTNTDITFLAVAEDGSGPVEFLWHFGDSRSARTTSRTITKRYSKPGRYETHMNYIKYNDVYKYTYFNCNPNTEKCNICFLWLDV